MTNFNLQSDRKEEESMAGDTYSQEGNAFDDPGGDGVGCVKIGKSAQGVEDRKRVIELGNVAVNLSNAEFEIIAAQLMKSDSLAVRKLCALLVSKRET